MSNNDIAVCTTFPDNCWSVYAEQMLRSYVQYWPADIPLMVQLDDDLLFDDVDKILREQDGIAVGWEKDHADFVKRNKEKDHPTDYRKQAVRFCHKVFAIKRALDARDRQMQSGHPGCRYLIWMDADVVTTRQITIEDIKKCLPKEGDAVAYLGRKDWDHSECGWLAFDLENGGDKAINNMYEQYTSDALFIQEQWHDSYIWDQVFKRNGSATNLTQDKPGMEIWPQSPMASWSIHYKGPAAKNNLIQNVKAVPGQNFQIQTKNAIPHEQIRDNISRNQKLIKNWLVECEPNDETIIIASAGPGLIPEELRNQPYKIVAVKHALKRLKDAGVKPWACILLDPRPHVLDFVDDADTEVKWIVASQVNPAVTEALLGKGCDVWGYHATVGADEGELIAKQPLSVINGGSATATRGLMALAHIGFRKFILYGYDLSYPDKPDMSAKDSLGQPKYLEFSVSIKDRFVEAKRHFFSEPQLIAQYQEILPLLQDSKYKIDVIGDGLVPYVHKYQKLGRLREEEIKCKMGGKLKSYKELWNKTSANKSLTAWLKISLPTLLKRKAKSK